MDDLKILFLEDSVTDVELVQRTLRKANIKFSPRVVETREDFINAIYNFKPDIILSDHSLPQFNSWEALKIVKKLNFYAPFILVTGSVSEEFAVECMKLGADDYILKDSLLRLPTSIKTILSKRDTEKEMFSIRQLHERLTGTYRELALAHNEIQSSIKYAKHIQSAILCKKEILSEAFPKSFVLYKPKDIVSGDFYWFAERDNKLYVAAADCTGHGVPGAFMSILGTTLLNEIINDKTISTPAQVLEALDKSVRHTLGHRHEDDELLETRDGMDIGLCCIDKASRQVQFAGANRPLFYFNKGQLAMFKGNRRGIGGHNLATAAFTNQVLSLQEGGRLYLFTDGFADQLGGKKDKKMMTKSLVDLLNNTRDVDINEQEKIIDHFLLDWQGTNEQTDDILMIGVQL